MIINNGPHFVTVTSPVDRAPEPSDHQVQLEFADGTLTNPITLDWSWLDFPYEVLELYDKEDEGFSKETEDFLLRRNKDCAIETEFCGGVGAKIFKRPDYSLQVGFHEATTERVHLDYS